MTNLVSYRHEVLPREQEDEIKHVLFLDPFECLISINTNGLTTFYAIGDSKYKNRIMFEKQYMTESMTKVKEPFPITAVKFDRDFKVLLVAD